MLKPIIAATSLLLSGFAAAAAPDVFDSHCADVVLLQVKPVQKELGITEAQRKRMNKHADNHRQELAALEKQVQGQKNANPQPQLVKYYNELKTNVINELTPGQLRRLREISLQRVGNAALCDPVVARKIGMTSAQTKKMQTVYSEGVQKFSQLERTTMERVLAPYKGKTAKTKQEAEKLNAEVRAKLDAAKKSILPQMKKLRDSYNAQMLAVLTSSQRAAFQALKGKPFHA